MESITITMEGMMGEEEDLYNFLMKTKTSEGHRELWEGFVQGDGRQQGNDGFSSVNHAHIALMLRGGIPPFFTFLRSSTLHSCRTIKGFTFKKV